MSSPSWVFTNVPESRTSSAELIRTHRAQIALEAEQRELAKRAQLEELSSMAHSPEVRIRLWEKLHALRLPLDPEHPVLHFVAMSTSLTVAQVQEEQLARKARSVATNDG
jgi:hypothetical protein